MFCYSIRECQNCCDIYKKKKKKCMQWKVKINSKKNPSTKSEKINYNQSGINQKMQFVVKRNTKSTDSRTTWKKFRTKRVRLLAVPLIVIIWLVHRTSILLQIYCLITLIKHTHLVWIPYNKWLSKSEVRNVFCLFQFKKKCRGHGHDRTGIDIQTKTIQCVC